MLFPSNLFDTMDMQYLNYSHSHIPSPLKTLNIELHNLTYFSYTTNVIKNTTTDKSSSLVDKLASTKYEHPQIEDIISFQYLITPETNSFKRKTITHEKTCINTRYPLLIGYFSLSIHHITHCCNVVSCIIRYGFHQKLLALLLQLVTNIGVFFKQNICLVVI